MYMGRCDLRLEGSLHLGQGRVFVEGGAAEPDRLRRSREQSWSGGEKLHADSKTRSSGGKNRTFADGYVRAVSNADRAESLGLWGRIVIASIPYLCVWV